MKIKNIPNKIGRLNLCILFTVLLFNTSIAQDEQTQEQQASDTSSAEKIMEEKESLDEIVLLGSRALPRTQTESPVPVDVININQVSSSAPQVTMNAILNYTAPSFTSTTQTVADGTDHIDPANLRGLGPDQTLILVNGKRRHTTALVNINGTMGRGSVGTDLNAIPSMAIERLEVLRDGAAAQYGSDAIAGVINLGLKENSHGTNVRVTTGANITSFESYTEAGKADYTKDKNNTYKSQTAFDGLITQVGINHGLKLSDKGFINITATFDYRGYTTRAGERTGAINNSKITGLATDDAYLASVGRTRDDYKMRVGQSDLLGGQLFYNLGYNIKNTESTEMKFYSFGGFGYRRGVSAGFYRLPFDARNIRGVYSNGFLPLITSGIIDGSLAFGLKGRFNKDWYYDVSNNIGINSFAFGVENSLNASAGNKANYTAGGTKEGLDSTKSVFDCGRITFYQNTFNIDISRNFNILAGLNFAAGMENRSEIFQQTEGEVASWANYNARKKPNLNTVSIDDYDTTVASLLATGSNGVPQAGAQVFPGYRPNAAFTESRTSNALYIDLEQNFTKAILLNVAGRYEFYSDFGSNFSGKVATRIKPFEFLSLRGSVSTGFRAPSLHQRYTFKTSSVIVAGVATEQGTLRNDSKAAELLGIPSLKPEISLSYSVGLTLNVKQFKFTVDAFQTEITDRIIYTDAFSGSATSEIGKLLLQAQAGSALFFANAVDTRNRGIDVVFSYDTKIAQHHHIRVDLSGTLSEVELMGDPKTSDILKPLTHVYLSPINKALLTQAFPREKANLILNYNFKKFGFFFRESYVGGVTHVEGTYSAVANNPSGATGSYYFKQELGALFLSDVSVSYNVIKALKVTVGANNLFDIYSDIISASKGKYFKIETDNTKPRYNTTIDEKSAKELGIANDDGITTNNQFVYSRRTSQIGLNGRFVFLRLEFNF